MRRFPRFGPREIGASENSVRETDDCARVPPPADLKIWLKLLFPSSVTETEDAVVEERGIDLRLGPRLVELDVRAAAAEEVAAGGASRVRTSFVRISA